MKVLIVYTHPNPKSFNHAILETVQSTLESKKHEVHVRDLYQMQFNPVLSAKDLAQFQQRLVPADIAEEHKWIRWAEAIIFIHPIWWYDRPAMLKGWLDRTLNYGFAFKMVEGIPVGLFEHGKALVLQTAGGKQENYKRSTGAEILHTSMKEGTLEFCGIKNTTCKTFYFVTSASTQERQKMLEEVQKLTEAF